MTVLVVDNPTDDTSRPETIVMLTASGEALASTNFNAPVRVPSQGCVSVSLPAVRVAAGAAYFADSTGAIRRLAPDSSVTEVASFPINASSLLSFAVSPDGKKLIAIIITSPPVLGGHFTLDLEEANAGGPTVKVIHKDLGAVLLPGPTLIAGWDQAGPLATLDSNLCVNNPSPSTEFTGDALIHLAPDGAHLDRIGGSGCLPLDEAPDGTILCSGAIQPDGGQSFAVRTRVGTLIWNAEASGLMIQPRLSPNGSALVVDDPEVDLMRRDAQQSVSLAQTTGSQLSALGWFGNDYIVVLTDGTKLGLVAINGNLDGVITLGKTVPSSATVTAVGTIGI